MFDESGFGERRGFKMLFLSETKNGMLFSVHVYFYHDLLYSFINYERNGRNNFDIFYWIIGNNHI